MVVLDTNIVIDHLRQYPKKSKLREIEEKTSSGSLAISVITVQELYEGKSTLDKTRGEILVEVISNLKILPYTFETAKLAGAIAWDLDYSIDFADVAIAATSILNKASFFTLNKKDFKEIKGLKLI